MTVPPSLPPTPVARFGEPTHISRAPPNRRAPSLNHPVAPSNGRQSSRYTHPIGSLSHYPSHSTYIRVMPTWIFYFVLLLPYLALENAALTSFLLPFSSEGNGFLPIDADTSFPPSNPPPPLGVLEGPTAPFVVFRRVC